jgi:hypothetical protein
MAKQPPAHERSQLEAQREIKDPPWTRAGWLVKESMGGRPKNWRLRHVVLASCARIPEISWSVNPGDVQLAKRTLQLETGTEVVMTERSPTQWRIAGPRTDVNYYELQIRLPGQARTLKLRAVRDDGAFEALEQWKLAVEQAVASMAGAGVTSVGAGAGDLDDEEVVSSRPARPSFIELLGTDASEDDLFPTYAVSLDAVLALTRLRPHEEMLEVLVCTRTRGLAATAPQIVNFRFE